MDVGSAIITTCLLFLQFIGTLGESNGPYSVFATIGRKVIVPCTYSGKPGRVIWTEQSGKNEYVLYLHAADQEDIVMVPPGRKEQDLERYHLDGYNLVIEGFRPEDGKRKCCEIEIEEHTVKRTCVDIQYADRNEDTEILKVYADEGTEDGTEDKDDDDEDCNCLAKQAGLGVAAGVSFIAMIGLSVYIYKFLN